MEDGESWLMNKETAPRRFGPDFVAEQLRRYGKRPPENRMLSYDMAVLEEYEPWRIWLDDQLDLLPDGTAAVFAANLWRDQNFWPDIIEIAAGDALRRKGLTVEFERRWGNLTPDWTVIGEAGVPVTLVEVLTHSPPKGTSSRMKAWHALVERLKQIPVPVVLTVAGDPSRPLDAPDARTAKKIAQDLRGALLSPLQRSEFRSQGYTFLLQADPRTRQPMRPPGMRTILIPPSNMAGVISAQSVAAGIQKKISKYHALAEEAQVPLIVAVGADKFTGLEVQHFDNLLRGAPTLSVQFNFGDSFIHKPVDIDPSNPPRWTMPPELAGVLWVNNDFPFTSAWRPNPAATTPAPPGFTGQEPCLAV